MRTHVRGGEEERKFLAHIRHKGPYRQGVEQKGEKIAERKTDSWVPEPIVRIYVSTNCSTA